MRCIPQQHNFQRPGPKASNNHHLHMWIHPQKATMKEKIPLDNKKKAALRAKANSLDVSLQVGKGGITDATIAELHGQLKSKKLVKVRLLPSAQGTELDVLAEGTRSEIVEKKGHTAVFYRR
jgi:RNA-binding protein YhbY